MNDDDPLGSRHVPRLDRVIAWRLAEHAHRLTGRQADLLEQGSPSP